VKSPLVTECLFQIGPAPIGGPVVVSWTIVAGLSAVGYLLSRRLTLIPDGKQAFIELLVETVDAQIRDTMRVAPGAYRAFIGSLFLFILTANWSGLLPGVEPPTACLQTDMALAVLVFLSVVFFGVRAHGWRGYLSTFASPSPLMIPLNFIETLTRTFSLFVRLFGNVMSGVFVIGIVLSLAGLLVPIPLMALHMLTGAVQAYIFAVLAMVFIAEGLESHAPGRPEKETP
jgi:F-type H+-transporting ATPase subunit a